MKTPRTVYLPGASGSASVYERLLAEVQPAQEPPLVFDYPGLGASPTRADVGSLDQLYRFVLREMPNQCDLVAVSMGCVLALRAALEQPARIRRLVLIATAGGVDVPALGGSDWRSGWVQRRPTAPRWFIDDHSDFSARLGEIQSPTLLIFGDADPIAPVSVGRFLSERLPRANLEIIPNATHNVVEDFAPELSALIARHFQHVD